ncbi:MAG: ComEC/Rec2 family competence protein [Symbiobacteriia bacterium]
MRSRIGSRIRTLSVFLIVAAVLSGCAASAVAPGGRLEVDFIDVGQADSILVRQGDHAMLVDAGNNADAATVTGYLTKRGVKRLEVVVGTHPHEDHIGSLDKVIESFAVREVIMPKATTTTKTFSDVIAAIRAKGLSVTTPVPGNSFKLGDATVTILAPNSAKYDDLNNYSVALRVVYGETSFLLTGDAQALSEAEMLASGRTLKADVLKVGHHGSVSSTTEAFLSAVAPKYAVISVGKDNDYGHPSRSMMQRLKARGIPVYRTDESGTIVAVSDGMAVRFDVQPGDYRDGGQK